jgi:hypothetical protein
MNTNQSWRLLPSVTLGAVCTLGGGYAVNELTNAQPAWWWAVVAVSLIGLVLATLWGYHEQSRPPSDQPAPSAPIVNQPARDVRISADNNSVAAWSIDTVNMSPASRQDLDDDDDRR